MSGKIRAALLIVSLSFPASAKEIDLRNQTDTEGEYNIAFCARPSPAPAPAGLPGHMFVAFSKTVGNNERTFVAIGHTIGAGVKDAAALWSYFKPVNGLLKEEMYTSIQQNCLDVRVNKADFDKAFAKTADPLASLGITTGQDVVLQQYSLGAEDCMTFTVGVAQVIAPRGLVVPARGGTELPMDYIQRLVNAN